MQRIIVKCKTDLLDIYKHAIDAVKPEQLVKGCVAVCDGKLVISDPVDPDIQPLRYNLDNTKIHVVGGGKCVLAMARGLAAIAERSQTSHLFSHGCLSAPIHSKSLFDNDVGTRNLLKSLGISVHFGSENNLPDANSVLATQTILDTISEASRIDQRDKFKSIYLVLLSGGGSACLTSPKRVTLSGKSKLIKELVQQGADIVELNTVRKCLSKVKGGNLARYILESNPDSQIISLIISDVINDPIDMIASGPTCLSNREELERSMARVLRKYNLQVPHEAIEETPEENAQNSLPVNKIIGNNKIAIRALKERAGRLGYDTTILGHAMSGSTRDVLEDILIQAEHLEHDRLLVVAGGESTVSLKPGETWGAGGRVQEMALDYVLHALSADPSVRDEGCIDMFMACSTDGQDGPTDVAAIFASKADWPLDGATPVIDDITRAKRSHDSYNFWMKTRPDWLVRTGTTGTNVMDVYMLMKVKAPRA